MLHEAEENRQFLTREAVYDPREGDVFHEMFSFGWQVLNVSPTHVHWRSFNTKEVDRGICTREEWKTKFKYGTLDAYTATLATRGHKPKVWVRYMEYDERFPGHRMWVSGCEGCNLGTFRYHHWAAAFGSALEHYDRGCVQARKQAIDRGIKNSKAINSRPPKMKELSCGVYQHLGGSYERRT